MENSKKLRADDALVKQGLAPSKSRAAAMISAGKVLKGQRPVKKPGQYIPAGERLTLKEPDHPWVSRGGLKLVFALDHFKISLKGRVVLDIGASTGGFTDVALNNGAAKVYAVDVGKDQLDQKLRADPRVVSLEGVNARNLTREMVPEPVDALICDASFISLKTVLPAPLSLLQGGGVLIALIKPQFEAGRGRLGKGGVVRDPLVHTEILQEIEGWLQARAGLSVLGVTESPVTGPKGNREFLIAAKSGK